MKHSTKQNYFYILKILPYFCFYMEQNLLIV